MRIAINALKLALLIAMVTVYLIGQGWLAFKLVAGQNRFRNHALLQIVPLALVSGFITNLGIVLLFQNLKFALLVGGALSIPGTHYFVREIKSNDRLSAFTSKSMYPWMSAIFLCAIFLSAILANPLNNWDARSIWFFHAKMIYTAGSVGTSAGWQDPSVNFSHPDYPILVPALTAQIATVVGFWNEFLPKLSLFFLLIPPILWMFTFARKSISFVILLLLIPFTFDKVLWNGLMDGYLALYFSVALLLLGRYLQSSQSLDLSSALSCLFLLLYLKNEGALATLTGLCGVALVWFLQGKITSFMWVRNNWKYYAAGVIALFPFLLWAIYKRHWGLSNDLEIGSFQSVNRLIARITDGSYRLVLENIYRRIEWTLLLLTLLCFAATWKKSFPKEALPALLAAALYCLGLITVYLLTPNHLEWQVRTSINRTILSVNAGLFAGCYFLLRALEIVPAASKLAPTTTSAEETSSYTLTQSH